MAEDPAAAAARWSDRQRRMLAAMGVRMWTADADAESAAGAIRSEAAAAPAVAAVPVAAPDGSHAGAESLAGGDWAGLRAAVAGCTRCRLHQGRTQAVFGSGATDAGWLLVGDPPAADEDAAGEPFVGPAGLLLDRMLAALHLSRASAPDTATTTAADPASRLRRVYTTLAMRCRPSGGGPPGAAEWAACQGHLQQQIGLLRPRVVLVLGRIAAQSLLRSEAPIGRLRGQVHRHQGLPLVVTYHPAYLLRHPDLKAAAWEDLCRAAALLDAD